MSDKFGERIADYEDLYFLEKIHNYEIYGGYSKILNKQVSLKIIKKDQFKDKDLLLKKIQNEEKILKECKSENILDFYRYFETKDNIIFEQEFYQSNLREYLMENGPSSYDLEFFKEVILGVSEALKTLYKKGVIHRNIRTSSIFLIENNGKRKIKLGEFGTAIFKKDNVSEPLNSIFYTAPEIINGDKYDERCDLWGFGISLYELYFGTLPFGSKPSRVLIIKKLSDESSFTFEKTKIPSLDYLFERLLKIDPNKRITHKELFNFVVNKTFMNANETTIIKKKSSNEILLKSMISYNYDSDSDSDNINSNNSININEDQQVYNNILYYDENLRNDVLKDCNFFEKETLGGFILCTCQNDLEQIKKEILNENKKYKDIKFNLISTGSTFQKIITFLQNDIAFDNCFESYCIYCKNFKKYENFKYLYPKLKGIYIYKNDVIQFIKNTSSNKIRPFKIIKLLTYNKCPEEYLKMAKFYGNIKKEVFSQNYEEMEKYIKKKDKKYKLEKDKSDLLDAFNAFNKNDNILIINKFNNVLYNDFCNFIDDECVYSKDFIEYFKSRIMYSYSNLDKISYYQWNDKALYMAKKLLYSELLQYTRVKGKMAFTNFSKFYKNHNSAIQKINSSMTNESNQKWTVIFILTNDSKIEDLKGIIQKNENDKEESVLYLPFSFFLLQGCRIYSSQNMATIFLCII